MSKHIPTGDRSHFPYRAISILIAIAATFVVLWLGIPFLIAVFS